MTKKEVKEMALEIIKDSLEILNAEDKGLSTEDETAVEMELMKQEKRILKFLRV